MARAFSGKIFNRAVDSGNKVSVKLGAELAAMAANTVPDIRASGANLECDWRVSTRREAAFHEMFDTIVVDPDEPQDIAGKMAVYFSDRIRQQTIPDFHLRSNADNLDRDLAPDTLLVHVHKVRLDPTLIGTALGYSSGRIHSVPGCEAELETLFPPGSAGGELFVPGSFRDSRRQAFIEKLFGSTTKPKFHPIWAGLWNRPFESIVGMGPDAWLAAFGVRNPRKSLCLLFRYRLSDLRVFRPTYLDSGAYVEHFPSPPSEVPWNGSGKTPHGGHPMSLSSRTDGDPILQEFIHKDMVRKPEHLYAWGWTSTTPDTKDLETSRREHHHRLGRYYTDLDKWLAEPI